MYERNYRISFSVRSIKNSVVACFFSWNLARANFVTGGGKKGLDKEGAKKEANTDEEVESIYEGSALLRSKSEHKENAVRG